MIQKDLEKKLRYELGKQVRVAVKRGNDQVICSLFTSNEEEAKVRQRFIQESMIPFVWRKIRKRLSPVSLVKSDDGYKLKLKLEPTKPEQSKSFNPPKFTMEYYYSNEIRRKNPNDPDNDTITEMAVEWLKMFTENYSTNPPLTNTLYFHLKSIIDKNRLTDIICRRLDYEFFMIAKLCDFYPRYKDTIEKALIEMDKYQHETISNLSIGENGENCICRGCRPHNKYKNFDRYKGLVGLLP